MFLKKRERERERMKVTSASSKEVDERVEINTFLRGKEYTDTFVKRSHNQRFREIHHICGGRERRERRERREERREREREARQCVVQVCIDERGQKVSADEQRNGVLNGLIDGGHFGFDSADSEMVALERERERERERGKGKFFEDKFE